MDDQAVQQEDSLGQELKNYREYKRMSVQELAQELYISQDLVEQIEHDDCLNGEELSVFIRGYYRNYAKIVGYPIDKLEDYLVEQGAMQPRTTTPSQQFKFNNKSTSRKWLWLSIIFLLGCVALFAGYSQYYAADESLQSAHYEDSMTASFQSSDDISHY